MLVTAMMGVTRNVHEHLIFFDSDDLGIFASWSWMDGLMDGSFWRSGGNRSGTRSDVHVLQALCPRHVEMCAQV
jgi:hypothetical protein